MRFLPILVAVLAVTSAASAADKVAKDSKDCMQVAQLTVTPRAVNPGTQAAMQVDRLALCHQERAKIEASIQGLRNQITAAKAQLSAMSGLSFHCVDNQTSANNKGVAEYCTPNACLPDTGRCANEIHSSADCAPGFYWDSTTGNCVAPVSSQSQ